MKILVTGINGQAGWELARRGPGQGYEIIGCSHADLDITDHQSLTAKLEEISPALVINCAAYTAVDQAESDKKTAWAVNRDGPACLAKGCLSHQIPLIHLSTDYVFDGRSSRPYKENDPVNPLGVYGKSKEAGEQEIRRILPAHLIIRTSWVFGAHGHNFVKTMLRLGKTKKELKVVADQWGCPTFAGDLADGLLKICRKIQLNRDIPWGTYHYCGSSKVSWYEFAMLIFAAVQDKIPLRVKKVAAITTGEFPAPAKRPGNSVLDCSRIKHAFNVEGVDVNLGLLRFLRELERIEEQ